MNEVTRAQSLKSLKTQLQKMEGKTEALKDEFRIANRAFQNHQDTMDSLQKRIQQLEFENSELMVTEHAVLRYIERELSDFIDLDEIRKSIVESVREPHERLGNGKYPIQNSSVRAVVRNNAVVTVE